MKIMSLLLLLMSLSPQAFAQQGSGNGGDAIVCPNYVRLADSVQAERSGYPILFNATENSLSKMLATLIERIKEKDLTLAGKIEMRATALLADIQSYEANGQLIQSVTEFGDGELPDVADEGVLFVPVGCHKQQLVIRTPQPLPNQKQYSIRRDLWIKMTEQEKAATILHESIYGYLVDAHVNSSPSARWYNALVLGNVLKTISDQELAQQMASFKFPNAKSWTRNSFGFIYNPLTSVTYGGDGSILKMSEANLNPSAQFEVIKSGPVVKKACKIEFENGVWTRMEVCQEKMIFAPYHQGPEKYNYDIVWGDGGQYGDHEIRMSGKDAKYMNSEPLLGFDNAIIQKTNSGYEIQATRYVAEFDKLALITPFGLLSAHHVLRDVPVKIVTDSQMHLLDLSN